MCACNCCNSTDTYYYIPLHNITKEPQRGVKRTRDSRVCVGPSYSLVHRFAEAKELVELGATAEQILLLRYYAEKDAAQQHGQRATQLALTVLTTKDLYILIVGYMRKSCSYRYCIYPSSPISPNLAAVHPQLSITTNIVKKLIKPCPYDLTKGHKNGSICWLRPDLFPKDCGNARRVCMRYASYWLGSILNELWSNSRSMLLFLLEGEKKFKLLPDQYFPKEQYLLVALRPNITWPTSVTLNSNVDTVMVGDVLTVRRFSLDLNESVTKLIEDWFQQSISIMGPDLCFAWTKELYEEESVSALPLETTRCFLPFGPMVGRLDVTTVRNGQSYRIEPEKEWKTHKLVDYVCTGLCNI